MRATRGFLEGLGPALERALLSEEAAQRRTDAQRAEAAGRGDGGCQDIMVWYAGLCAYAVHSQSPEGPEGHDFAPVGRLVAFPC